LSPFLSHYTPSETPFAGKNEAARKPADEKLDFQLRGLRMIHNEKHDSQASHAHQEVKLKSDLRKVGILTTAQRALGGRERIHGPMHTPATQQKHVSIYFIKMAIA
jgi:hypothetical protein